MSKKLADVDLSNGEDLKISMLLRKIMAFDLLSYSMGRSKLHLDLYRHRYEATISPISLVTWKIKGR